MTRVACALLIILLAAAPAFGEPPLREAVAVLEGLDPGSIPTGRLIDRALSMAGLELQDGSGTGPAVDAAGWRQMLHELRLASPVPPAGWPTPEQVRRQARQAKDAGTVPIAVLDAGYARLRPDALERGLVVWRDGLLVESLDKGGPSPYLERRAFAAAALLPRTYRGAQVTFTIPAALLATDAPRSAALEVDLADGRGWRPAATDQPLVASYDATGPRTLRLRATAPDGTARVAAFAFEVAALAAPLPTETWPITATVPYQGAYGIGQAYVYLAPGHATVTEPVVIVEGFDMDNLMDWDELYDLLNQENMIEELRADGFDAVVLNFNESTDDIRRNAMILVELLQQVGVAQPDSRDRVVIGASMGGLVARYALAWMQQQGLDPSARTFISFDSPQLGANIPLGVQYWLELFQIESTEAGHLLSRLDTPAARQMLLYHHSASGGGTGEPATLRGAFLADLAAVGDWPQGLRKVGVANGSGQAQGQGYAPGTQLISYEYYSFLVDLIGNVWAVPDGGSRQILRGLIDRIWPLPNDELNVTVSGTSPWDSAPGGWRASLADMDATPAPYGDIVALYPNHCFIPTVSALALGGMGPYTNVSQLADPAALSPFDAVYFPAANQEHILVTAENKAWFAAEIARQASGVHDEMDAVAALRPRVLGVRPNPFNPATEIIVELPRAGAANVEIFDLAGRRVRTLVQCVLPAGRTAVAWDGRDDRGRDQASGTFVCRVSAVGGAGAQLLTLVR
ncbi:MAG: hypothetical protein IPK64_03050 [bacterium]|nr:hypothetical protein [bacterium]